MIESLYNARVWCPAVERAGTVVGVESHNGDHWLDVRFDNGQSLRVGPHAVERIKRLYDATEDVIENDCEELIAVPCRDPLAMACAIAIVILFLGMVVFALRFQG